LHNAQASLSELDTQAMISNRLGFISNEPFRLLETAMDHEDKLLTGLIKSLKRSQT
jgi:four helix bundle protein